MRSPGAPPAGEEEVVGGVELGLGWIPSHDFAVGFLSSSFWLLVGGISSFLTTCLGSEKTKKQIMQGGQLSKELSRLQRQKQGTLSSESFPGCGDNTLTPNAFLERFLWLSISCSRVRLANVGL